MESRKSGLFNVFTQSPYLKPWKPCPFISSDSPWVGWERVEFGEIEGSGTRATAFLKIHSHQEQNHMLEDFILVKCPYLPKWSIDSILSPLKSQWPWIKAKIILQFIWYLKRPQGARTIHKKRNRRFAYPNFKTSTRGNKTMRFWHRNTHT